MASAAALAEAPSRRPHRVQRGYGLTDIAAQRFDAGVRLGDQVAQDMIAVRVASDLRMAVAGSPD
ncbi:hypothetical protein Bpla01_21580 [Burkholderia plantarii]|nr:hypothetical protein Bpla01_21580 [Burkholderia plantarii]